MPRTLSWITFVASILLAASGAAADEPLRGVIDTLIAAKLSERDLEAASRCDDATFLRRIHLDLVGEIPTADDAKVFLGDAAPDKRDKLIDRLLADPRYAQRQADEWDLLYFGRNPPGYETDKRPGFQRWLREQFAQNTPYDQIARAILKAEGNTAEQGAPHFFVQYSNQPEDAAVKITQTFLGVQLQCARCHDHPFEAWTQLDFYGVAAFLARLQVVNAGEKEKQKRIFIGERNKGEVNFTGPASQTEPGKKGEPVAPKFLLGEKLVEPEPDKDEKNERLPDGKEPPAPKFSRKGALADWIVSAENPFFARAVTNRVWAQFMGRGLVHPVDNMSQSNAPSHPELLAEMRRQLVEHKFDLKWFIRELVSSETYQRASAVTTATSAPAEPPQWFERGSVRPLSAEELVASWRIAVRLGQADDKMAERLAAGERMYPLGEYQMKYFGTPNDGVGNFIGGLHEQLYLNNGGIDRLFDFRPGSLLAELADKKSETPWPERVERMYLSALSRKPTPEEFEKFVSYLSAGERQEERLREALWALITSAEFRFNH